MRVTHEEMVERLVSRPGTIVLLGGVDTGKTTFGLTVAEAARSKGVPVGYIDADIGQSTIGPPTCVGLKLCADLEQVTTETVSVADELGFVGATSPEGHLLPLLTSTTRLVNHAREAGCELVIVDTSGYISGVYAEVLKYYKLELIRPEAVVAFQRGGELVPLLGVIQRFLPVEVAMLRVESEVVERSVEERLAYREGRLAKYLTEPLSRWRVKTTVFMPSLPPLADLSRLDGVVVGLEDGKGTCLGIGLLEYDSEESVLRMVSPVTESAKGLRLGSLKINAQGKMLGKITLRDLFTE